MNFNDIKDMSNAEAVAYYSPLTVSFIPCGDLENLLDWSGVAKRNAISGAWEGSLIDFMQSNVVPALSAGLGELFGHLNKPRSTGIDTNEQPWGSKMSDLLAGLEAVGAVSPLLKSDVIALAGGLAHADLDDAAVQSIRDEEAVRVKRNQDNQKFSSLFNEHVSSLMDGSGSDADIIAGINAMASNWSN